MFHYMYFVRENLRKNNFGKKYFITIVWGFKQKIDFFRICVEEPPKTQFIKTNISWQSC